MILSIQPSFVGVKDHNMDVGEWEALIQGRDFRKTPRLDAGVNSPVAMRLRTGDPCLSCT